MKVGFLGGKFLPFHQGHVYMIMAASTIVDKLYVVLSSSENRDRQLCERDGVTYIPAEVRLSWIGNTLNDLQNIEIIHIKDTQWDENYDWDEGADAIKKAIHEKITHVFSSETSYNEMFAKNYPDAQHIVIDEGRCLVPISATELRRSIYNNWNMLPPAVASFFTKKVLITGTESCGKSTLVKKLAKFYNTNYVPEVGRVYCEKYKNMLTPDMFSHIAMEHYMAQIHASEHSNKFLFVDSDATITKYYLQEYGSKDGFSGDTTLIDAIINKQKYDVILYLEPDVPWVSDGYRFLSDEWVRNSCNDKLKAMYKDVNLIPISGDYESRFMQSINILSRLL